MNNHIPKRSATVTAVLSVTFLLCVTFLFTLKLSPLCHFLLIPKAAIKKNNSLWATAHGFPCGVCKVPLSCLWLLTGNSIATNTVLFRGIQGAVLPDVLWQPGRWRRAMLHRGWVMTTCCHRKWWRWTRRPAAHGDRLWTRWTRRRHNSSWWWWKSKRLHCHGCACWWCSTLVNGWRWRWSRIIHVRNQDVTRGISHFHTSHHNLNSRRQRNLFTSKFAAW